MFKLHDKIKKLKLVQNVFMKIVICLKRFYLKKFGSIHQNKNIDRNGA